MNPRYAVMIAVAAMWFAVAAVSWAESLLPWTVRISWTLSQALADTANSKNMAMVVVPFDLYGPYLASLGVGQVKASPAAGAHTGPLSGCFRTGQDQAEQVLGAAQLRQSNYVYLLAAGTTTVGSFYRLGVIDGCKGSIKVTDDDANGTPENALWSASCGRTC